MRSTPNYVKEFVDGETFCICHIALGGLVVYILASKVHVGDNTSLKKTKLHGGEKQTKLNQGKALPIVYHFSNTFAKL